MADIIHQIDTVRTKLRVDDNFRCTYFIRHGECRSNIEWPIPGYTDEMDTLTPLGRRQASDSARLLASLMQAWNRDLAKATLYSSTLTRAQQTAEILRGCLSVTSNVQLDKRLVEYGGESEDHDLFLSRVESVFSELESLSHDAVVVCHGHTMQAFLALCLESDHNNFVASINNGGICVFHGRQLIHWNLVSMSAS